MKLPFFFNENVFSDASVALSEETSGHIVQVLRMKAGDKLKLTDGKGHLWLTTITESHKKKTLVQVEETTVHPPPDRSITIAMSPVKNTSRFEWFLEKATEIGVTGIIPVIGDRTEKQHFRYPRMNSILISAMLQSQQVWLPLLREPAPFKSLVTEQSANYAQKYICHCEEQKKFSLTDHIYNGQQSSIILIGPEGDFTGEEIGLALENGFKPLTLGETRLRTETAGIVAATLLKFI